MKTFILAAVLAAASAPALAGETFCEIAEGFAGDVMDSRLAGRPLQDVLAHFEHQQVRELVRGIYDAPRDALSGAGRADFMTDFRAYCHARWGTE